MTLPYLHRYGRKRKELQVVRERTETRKVEVWSVRFIIYLKVSFYTDTKCSQLYFSNIWQILQIHLQKHLHGFSMEIVIAWFNLRNSFSSQSNGRTVYLLPSEHQFIHYKWLSYRKKKFGCTFQLRPYFVLPSEHKTTDTLTKTRQCAISQFKEHWTSLLISLLPSPSVLDWITRTCKPDSPPE